MIIGQKSEITFDVNVMGTSAEPTVRLVFETHPQISFPAAKVGSDWKSEVIIPSSVAPGSYKMRVDVHLNGRVFSPFSKTVEIAGSTHENLKPQPVEMTKPALRAESSVLTDGALESAPPKSKPVEKLQRLQKLAKG